MDSIPTSTLINAHTGLPVMTLQDADFGPLLDAGFKFPEPFTAKADDGVTDIYGVRDYRTTLLGICGLDASKSASNDGADR